MRVFISWSGDRSGQLAKARSSWLKRVIQRLDPWLSIDDILKGQKWGRELFATLENTDVGILCITHENMSSPWILFESGALAKKGESRVIPYLLDLQFDDLIPPLKQFNAAQANKADTERMILSFNKLLLEDGLKDDELKETFEKWWPDLDAKIKDIPKSPLESAPKPNPDESLAKITEKLTALTNLVTEMHAKVSPGSYSYSSSTRVAGVNFPRPWRGLSSTSSSSSSIFSTSALTPSASIIVNGDDASLNNFLQSLQIRIPPEKISVEPSVGSNDIIFKIPINAITDDELNYFIKESGCRLHN